MRLWRLHYRNSSTHVLQPPLASRVTDLSDNKLQINIEAKSGLECNRALCVMLMGQMIEYSNLQGFPRSRVTMQPIKRGFRFEVSYVARGGLLSPVRRAIMRLLTTKRTIQELYESLQKEYRQLEFLMNAQRISEEKYRPDPDRCDHAGNGWRRDDAKNIDAQ